MNKVKGRRTLRTRAKLRGISTKPRLTVFRSNKFIYAQLIDDEQGKTLVSASSLELHKGKKAEKAARVDTSFKVGELIAERAGKQGISEAVFDRGSYIYHGRVKSVAEGARKGGLKI